MIRFDDILEKTSYFSEKDITLLQKAYVFAAQAHKGQVRHSGEPYLSHPLEVTNMLAEMKMDAVTLAASLLHDVLEDTDVTPLDLQKTFGKEIAHLVEGVTKISLVQESPPETRRAESIRKIILAMTDDLRVIFIKLADRIHNLKTLKFLPESKQRQIAKETLDIYAPIANRLGMGRIKAELEDLSFRYVDAENYFKILSLVEPKRKEAEKELKKIKRLLELHMKKNNLSSEISYRTKRLYSIYNKMKGRGIDFEQVYDFMALRIITNSVRNCYYALGTIHENWPHLPHRFRDFITMPKPNLYQSLHTTIITEKKQTIEIQIRTHEMHDLAENGIAAHWKYKEIDSHAVLKEDKRLHWLREMVEVYKEQKSPKQFLAALKTNLIPEEVTVFTPKGKRISFPLGASALDFAFKIHTEVGLHASGTKINGKTAPLKTILKAGDIVEILTSPEKQVRREWLNIAFTSTARHHIKRWVNDQDKKKNKALGKKLWEKELKKHSIPSEAIKTHEILNRISKETHFRIKKLEDFYVLAGTGKLVLNRELMEKIFPERIMPKRAGTLLKKIAAPASKKPKPVVQVKDIEGALVKVAKCCSPIKGEPIIGYITAGKGITVHSLRCPLIDKEILDNQRMVDVSWDTSTKGIYTGRLLIKTEDSPGVIASITIVIAKLEGNITKADIVTFPNKKAQIKISLKIKDIEHLNNIKKEISKIKEVLLVERI